MYTWYTDKKGLVLTSFILPNSEREEKTISLSRTQKRVLYFFSQIEKNISIKKQKAFTPRVTKKSIYNLQILFLCNPLRQKFFSFSNTEFYV
jgi:hypothetical protein